MRDPCRIKPIMRMLEECWLREPDLRLGQILAGAVQSKLNIESPFPELFYMEDDELVECLQAYFVKGQEPEPDSCHDEKKKQKID